MKIQKRVLRPFIAVTVVIIASTTATFFAGLIVLRARQDVQDHLSAIKEASDITAVLTMAETGQRGYLLTGDAAYLAPYQKAAPQVAREIQDLANTKLVSGTLIAQISRLADAKLAELARTIDLRQKEGPEAAVAIVRTNQGRELMQSIVALISDVTLEQEEQLHKATLRANSATIFRTSVFVFGGLVSILFVAWAYKQIQRESEQLTNALDELTVEREELFRQKELLNVTLASIGDCVIVTGMDGRITFMNEVASQLTGWVKSDAIGRPIEEVFRIVNELTREVVENPVGKVLRLGKIVGLANHTVLIRRDGTEVPIDDSGAPIRDSKGELLGAVLVFRDFSEYKQHESEILAERKNAEEANEAKDRFLAMLSHELRTPLSPVLSTLNRWEITTDLPGEFRGDLEMIRRSVELEARIIDDLLDVTRVSRGIFSLTQETVNIHALIEPLAGMYRTEVEPKHIRLDLHLDAAGSHVRLDASRLQQVIWNLLRNAAKFTDANGTISVRTFNGDSQHITISVKDTGIGMDAETIGRLFVPFQQGDGGISRKYGGLGLGLAISKGLVTLMGGEIAARSEGRGRGSEFTVTFPITEKPAAGAPVAPNFRTNGEARKLAILLVEDDTASAVALQRLLKARGHTVEVAGTVQAACGMLSASRFDLMLCDLGLPDGTGVDVVKHIKANGLPARAIAVSGFGMEQDIAACLNEGFDMHITKPVNIQRLESAFGKLFPS